MDKLTLIIARATRNHFTRCCQATEFGAAEELDIVDIATCYRGELVEALDLFRHLLASEKFSRISLSESLLFSGRAKNWSLFRLMHIATLLGKGGCHTVHLGNASSEKGFEAPSEGAAEVTTEATCETAVIEGESVGSAEGEIVLESAIVEGSDKRAKLKE